MPPTFINVLGAALEEKLQPLSKDLARFIDGAQHGIILFSLGFTMHEPEQIPKQVKSLFAAFSRLTQRIIMKLNTVPPNTPKNVKIMTFVPQQSILAHNKTLVFFTQGSVNAAMESIRNRVPMVGMPVYADQADSLTQLVRKGVAVRVDKGASEEQIYQAIVKVRDDPSYTANINILANLLLEERHTPLENAIWLMEYISRTKGAEHLKLASRKLSNVQNLSLDLIAFLIVAAFAAYKTAVYVSKRISSIPSRKLKSK
jgi:glucuronosyltransferase